MKASEIISGSCCGQGLPIECTKSVLAANVEKLECDRKILLSMASEYLNELNSTLNSCVALGSGGAFSYQERVNKNIKDLTDKIKQIKNKLDAVNG